MKTSSNVPSLTYTIIRQQAKTWWKVPTDDKMFVGDLGVVLPHTIDRLLANELSFVDTFLQTCEKKQPGFLKVVVAALFETEMYNNGTLEKGDYLKRYLDPQLHDQIPWQRPFKRPGQLLHNFQMEHVTTASESKREKRDLPNPFLFSNLAQVSDITDLELGPVLYEAYKKVSTQTYAYCCFCTAFQKRFETAIQEVCEYYTPKFNDILTKVWVVDDFLISIRRNVLTIPDSPDGKVSRKNGYLLKSPELAKAALPVLYGKAMKALPVVHEPPIYPMDQLEEFFPLLCLHDFRLYPHDRKWIKIPSNVDEFGKTQRALTCMIIAVAYEWEACHPLARVGEAPGYPEQTLSAWSINDDPMGAREFPSDIHVDMQTYVVRRMTIVETHDQQIEILLDLARRIRENDFNIPKGPKRDHDHVVRGLFEWLQRSRKRIADMAFEFEEGETLDDLDEDWKEDSDEDSDEDYEDEESDESDEEMD